MIETTSPELQKQQELELEKQRKELEEKEAAEFDAILKKYGIPTAFKIAVPVDDTYTDVLVGWLKYPSFEAYSIALTLEDKHPLKGKKILLESAWLEGDERLKDTDDPKSLPLFYSVCTVLDEIMEVRQALIKKKSLT